MSGRSQVAVNWIGSPMFFGPLLVISLITGATRGVSGGMISCALVLKVKRRVITSRRNILFFPNNLWCICHECCFEGV